MSGAPLSNPSTTLRIGQWARQRAARAWAPPGGIALIAGRQWLAERRARQLGEHFRTTSNDAAMHAYRAMAPHLFVGINARQAWANWYTIPATLHRRAPRRPLLALDLACGDGASTAALLYHLPNGSQVVGLEYAPQLVHAARQRRYPQTATGHKRVSIVVASILDSLCDAEGRRLPDQRVDWINCSGALAHHFHPGQLTSIAAECARVLRPGGWAAVDARSTTNDDPVVRAFTQAGFRWHGHERSCRFDRYPQCCFQLDESA